VTASTRAAISRVGSSADGGDDGVSQARGFAGVVLVLAAAGVLAGFFLGVYVEHDYTTPIGWDTARYIASANLVAEHGLRGVDDVDPPPQSVLSGRVGFSVMGLSLASLLRLSLFEVATILPVLGAVALALAGATFASTSLRWRGWEAAVVVLAIGLSPTLIRLIAPETYTENLLAGAPLVAALALVVSGAPLTGRTFGAALILLVVGGLIHGPSLAVVAGSLAFAAAWLAPSSWRAWREGQRLTDTPAGSLGVLVLGTGLLSGGVLLGVLGTVPAGFRIGREALAAKFRHDLGLYRFPLTVPVAAVGVSRFIAARRGSSVPRPAGSGGPGPRRTALSGERASLALLLLLGWTFVTLIGVALFLAGRASPAHRFLALFIPLPLLVGVGIVTLGRLTKRVAGRLGAAAVVVAGLAGFGVLGSHILYAELPTERQVLWMDEGKMGDAANAAAYLDRSGVARTTPVVFVVDDTGPQPEAFVPLMANMIRSVLPAGRIERAYMYVGGPDGYLAGAPTLRASPSTYNATSLLFFEAVEPVLTRPHVALLLSSFNPAFGEFPLGREDRLVARNVAVLRGPLLEHPLPDAVRPSAPRGLGLALAGLAIMGTVGLIGLGWGLTLLPREIRLFEVVGVAPAFGIATLVIAGVVVDAAGIRLTGVGGIAPIALAAVGGWGGAIVRVRRHGWNLFGSA
jgi:hypothetical protein